jgi:hypothetical protein
MASLDQTQISGPGDYLEGHRRARGGKWLIVGGYVAAFISPIIGLMIGLVLVIERRTGHGVAVVMISVALFAGAYVASIEHGVMVQYPQTSLQHQPDKFLTCVNNHLSGSGSLWRACYKLLSK